MAVAALDRASLVPLDVLLPDVLQLRAVVAQQQKHLPKMVLVDAHEPPSVVFVVEDVDQQPGLLLDSLD